MPWCAGAGECQALRERERSLEGGESEKGSDKKEWQKGQRASERERAGPVANWYENTYKGAYSRLRLEDLLTKT